MNQQLGVTWGLEEVSSLDISLGDVKRRPTKRKSWDFWNQTFVIAPNQDPRSEAHGVML